MVFSVKSVYCCLFSSAPTNKFTTMQEYPIKHNFKRFPMSGPGKSAKQMGSSFNRMVQSGKRKAAAKRRADKQTTRFKSMATKISRDTMKQQAAKTKPSGRRTRGRDSRGRFVKKSAS
jgi:hypothetical protein